MSTVSNNDRLRKRLQLSIGRYADLTHENRDADDRRAYASTLRTNGRSARVTLHAEPPTGPDPEILGRRLKIVGGLNHGVLDLPVACGEVEGRAWTLEAEPESVIAIERIAHGPLPVPLAVAVIRDVARALAALHRRGIAHGAVDLRSISITATGGRLGGLDRELHGSVRGDLDALGVVAWSLLSGETHSLSDRPLSSLRRGVSPALDAFCASLRAPDVADRPQRAEMVLEALDTMPSLRRDPLSSLVDGGLRSARSPRALGWLVIGAAIAWLGVVFAAE